MLFIGYIPIIYYYLIKCQKYTDNVVFGVYFLKVDEEAVNHC